MDDNAEVTNWIRLSRKLARSDWWLLDEFSRGQAWVDLLMLANWKDGQVRIRGVLIELKRGQLAASSVWLSERWKWSRGRVGRFLDELEERQQIGQQKTNVTNVLTITNYGHYQKTVQQNGQQTDSKRTANGQQTDTEEEGIRIDKEGTKKKKESSFNPKLVDIPLELSSEVFMAAWSNWCQHRQEIKKKLTPTSVKQQLSTLANIGTDRAVRMIEHTIEKGWTGLREPEESGGNGQGKSAKALEVDAFIRNLGADEND